MPIAVHLEGLRDIFQRNAAALPRDECKLLDRSLITLDKHLNHLYDKLEIQEIKGGSRWSVVETQRLYENEAVKSKFLSQHVDDLELQIAEFKVAHEDGARMVNDLHERIEELEDQLKEAQLKELCQEEW